MTHKAERFQHHVSSVILLNTTLTAEQFLVKTAAGVVAGLHIHYIMYERSSCQKTQSQS